MPTYFLISPGDRRRTVTLVVDAVDLVVQVDSWTIEVAHFAHRQERVVGRDPAIRPDVVEQVFQTGDALVVRMPVIVIADYRYADR